MLSTTEMAVPSQQQQPPPAKPKVKKSAAAHSNASGAGAKGRNAVDRTPPDPLELEMARQDLFKVAHPDTHTPFRSLEDACDRLLPYHVLAEYELEETEEVDGEVLSKKQAWEESMKKKTEGFVSTLERQVNTYNDIMKQLWEGDMRAEERMMVEQSLLVEEKQKLATVRAQIEAKEKEEREAAEAKAKEALAQAERARAEALARAEAQARAEAAQAEAQSKAEALRAEADSLAKAESQARLGGSSNAAVPAPEPVNMIGVLANNNAEGDWAQLDDEDDDGEDDDDDDDDLEEVWDDDEDDEEDDDEDADSLEDTEMVTDYDRSPTIQERLSKPS